MMLNNDLRKFQVANDRPEHITFSRKIAAAGQQFARTHLMGDDIFCYYFKLLQILSRTQMRMPAVVSGCTIPKAYAALQISKPEVREGMERLQQPNEELFPCSCHRQRANDEL